MLYNEMVTFVLDRKDTSSLFFQAGYNKGQVMGLLAPHIIAKYLKMIPVYTESDVLPEFVKDSIGNRYGYVYSSSNTFDMANSYELGFGRVRKSCSSPNKFDGMIFLKYLGNHKMVAYVTNIIDVELNQVNGKYNIRKFRSYTG